jgi:endonuclease/exonuclease/phosphatase family metal-dependent hydrolase
MQKRRLAIIALAVLALGACVRCETGFTPRRGITIMSYNVQTLFDPVDHGSEYAEFSVANGSWDEARYRTRLSALASAILAATPGGPDILVLQEIENARVLADLSEAVAPGAYAHRIMSSDEEAVLACGVASRLPFMAVRAHRYRPMGDGPPSVPRYLLECRIDTGSGKALNLLAVHWKSKLGGAAETEPERQAAAVLAASIIRQRLAADASAAVVLAGDFNCNPDEFDRSGSAYPTALMPSLMGPGPWLSFSFCRDEADAHLPVLYSPWEDFGGYSYRYAGVRERIDNFMLSPGLAAALIAFNAEPPGFLIGASGQPLSWNARTATGYSDHLPIRLTFKPES